MDYLTELEQAIARFVTREGATPDDIADSFCDLHGFTPDREKVYEGLRRLVAAGKVRPEADRDLYFWHETDEAWPGR